MTANSAFLGTLYAQIAVNTTALDHAAVKMQQFAQRAEVAMLRVQKSMMAAGAAMKTFGRSMTQFVTLPMALIGGASLKMFADFEFSMNKVVSLVGVAREQVDEWSKSILDIAPSLGKSPRELADAMYFITSAGIRGTQAMDILEESAKSSASGLGETKVIADLLTSAMNAYGKENLSAARANDILVATVREGKAEAALLAQSMGLVLPIAAAMGAEFTDVGAATAAMTRTGTKAATAAIQLRQMFNSILKPAEEAEEVLIDMGISSEQLRKIIDEGSLLDALQKLDAVTKEYGINAVGKVIPNIRSLTGFLDIMGKNVEDNIILWGSIEDSVGDAERTFQQTADTVRFRMAVAFSRVTTSATRFGETMSKVIVPILEKVAVFIEKVVKRFDTFSASQKLLIGRIGLVVVALGPFLTILGFLVGNVIPGLIMAVRGVTSAFVFMGRAIILNPIGALITVVITLVSLYALWKSRANQAAEAQMTLNKATKMAEESIASQRVAMNLMFRIAQDVNRSEEERAEAIKAINQESPEYLGNIKLETILQASATKAKEKYIAELVREAKVKAVMAELNQLEIDYLEEVTNRGAAVLNFWQKLAKFGSAGAMTIEETQSLISAFEDINLGNARSEFDATRKSLEDMLDTILETEDFASLLGGDGGGGVDGGSGLLAIAGVLRTYTDEVQFATDMQIAFGNSFDHVEHMLSASQTAVEGYLRAGMDPLDERIVSLVRNIGDLEVALQMRELKDFVDGLSQIEQEIVKLQDKEFLDTFTQATADMQKEGLKLTETIDELILSYYGLGEASETILEWTGILKSTFNGMQNVIMRSLNETENIFQAFGKFFADFIKGMIIKLVAATIAAAALAIVLSLLPGGNIGKVFEGLGAASSIGELFKRGFATFTGMQHGGIVPSGYPNDSFPAMLTSGEEVLPARRTRDHYGNQPMQYTFRIEGDDLVAVVDKNRSLAENY